MSAFADVQDHGSAGDSHVSTRMSPEEPRISTSSSPCAAYDGAGCVRVSGARRERIERAGAARAPVTGAALSCIERCRRACMLLFTECVLLHVLL